ncbi:MAG: hypothetical protein ABSD87_14120, partial [Candidatus Acidiferrales bacterium]
CAVSNEIGFTAPGFEFSLTSSTDATFIRLEDDSVSDVTYIGFAAGAGDTAAANARVEVCEFVGVLDPLEIVAGTAWN